MTIRKLCKNKVYYAQVLVGTQQGCRERERETETAGRPGALLLLGLRVGGLAGSLFIDEFKTQE